MRRSELFALEWSDIDFWNLVIEVRRSICEGVVGNCKTEASRSPIPLSLDVDADLWLWKENTNYAAHDDWVFASPRLKGKSSRRPDVVLRKVIQPAALRAGIKKRIGWHTFWYTYSTTLIANGENVKVVQELMQHANSRCTLDFIAKRESGQSGRRNREL